jgi:methylmalonyl-CoA/ethylmalonyl-CoA epimerase
MPSFEFDHVAVAVRSIKQALELYRDGLGGEYLMGGDQGSWRWLQLRFPAGGKVELLEPLGEGFLTKFLDSRPVLRPGRGREGAPAASKPGGAAGLASESNRN